MSIFNSKQLLEAGVHFGHHTRRWNPKMKEYIFTERNDIYIIDLQKTVKKFEEAYMFVRDISMTGGNILFVGTKKQASAVIKEEASRCSMYYVNVRWPGGMLTNYKTIKNSLSRLRNLQKLDADGTLDQLTKKEAAAIRKEIADLEKSYGGIKEMGTLPAAVFVVDTNREHNAIAEAKKLGIPVVAIIDTNCNPDDADYIIPGNDDAIKAIKLITSTLADAVIEGKQGETFGEAEKAAEVEVKPETDKPDAE